MMLNKKREGAKSKFIPYHHVTVFNKTHKATRAGEGVVCAILCFAVLESFINDLAGAYEYFSKNLVLFHVNDHPVNNYLHDQERVILNKLKELEREDVLTKLSAIGEWNKSENHYQSLKELKRIRNNLVHLKSEELEVNESGEFFGYPKFLNNFFQKKIIFRPKSFVSWIELLETREFCLWCQETTYQILRKSQEMLPESNIKKHFTEENYFFFSADIMRKRFKSIDENS